MNFLKKLGKVICWFAASAICAIVAALMIEYSFNDRVLAEEAVRPLALVFLVLFYGLPNRWKNRNQPPQMFHQGRAVTQEEFEKVTKK